MKTQYNIRNLNRVSDGYHETYLLISDRGVVEYISEKEIRTLGYIPDRALPLPLTRAKKNEIFFSAPRTFFDEREWTV